MNADGLLKYYERIADAPDAIARLRRFILDLAVRGKLVAQDLSDEPASELLKRIRKEKAALVAAGQMKRAEAVVDLSASEHNLPLPHGWTVTDLQSVCLSVTDGDHLPPPKAETGIPFLVIGNVRSQRIDFAGSRFVASQYYDALDPIRRPRSGDLLYTLVGSYGIPVIVRDDQPFCVQRHIGILRPSSLIDVNFLARAMESRFAFDQATACATGIAQKTVPLSGLRKLMLPLPPLAEQHRIVAKVDELMALCDRLEAARGSREATRDRLTAASLARLNVPDPATFHDHARFALDALPALTTRPDQIKHLRQTILNLAVRGKLVPQAPNDEPASELLRRIAKEKGRSRHPVVAIDPEGEPYTLPDTWKWAALDQLIISGPQNGISPKPTNRDDAPKAITLTATTSGVFNPIHFKHVEAKIPTDSEFWLKNGDLLFQRGNTREYVGMAAVYQGPPNTFLFPDLIIKVRISVNLSTRFAHMAAISPPARAFLSANASGAQATMPKINQTTLISLPMPIPPLAEQHRIVAKVDALMALCDRLEASLTATAATRRRLLDALLAEALAPTQSRQEAA